MGALSHSLWDLLSPSLVAQLIPLGLLEAGRISIALIIHSLDRRGSLSQSLFAPLIAPYKCTFQTGSKLDFVHLSSIADGVNHTFRKSR